MDGLSAETKKSRRCGGVAVIEGSIVFVRKQCKFGFLFN